MTDPTNTGTTKVTEVILISYEFTYNVFSGNGILARSLVKSLLKQGLRLTVWCCRPPPPTGNGKKNTSDKEDDNGKDHPLAVPELTQEQADRLEIVATAIPDPQKWHRLDDGSAWEEFCWKNVSKSKQQSSILVEAAKRAQYVLAIDWTGHAAWRSFGKILEHPLPLVYLNFRVFSSGIKDPEKRRFYDKRERKALKEAAWVVALSQKDKASLLAIIHHKKRSEDDDDEHDETTNNTHFLDEKIQVLVPPLRGDMEELALKHMKNPSSQEDFLREHMPPAAWKKIKAIKPSKLIVNDGKCFITCVVRLSPEKNTRRFAKFLHKTKKFWKDRQLIPLLAGSSSDPEYARLVMAEVKAVCGADNCVILDSFLPPESLVSVFSRAAFNFHPCSYGKSSYCIQKGMFSLACYEVPFGSLIELYPCSRSFELPQP